MRAIRATFARFFNERGTHLAAMVAYFALMSFVPLVFLALSILGFFDQADSSSALVDYLEDVFPEQSVESIVDVVEAVQENAATLSLIGAGALLWSSVSLFSALESAFNIMYSRPNRPFLRGKVLAAGYMTAALVVLFSGLTIGTFGYDLLRRYATDIVSNQWVALALTIVLSGAALFVFLLSSYHRLPNARLTYREVLPGALVVSGLRAGFDARTAAPADAIREVQGPVLLVHSRQDGFTPVGHSELIYAHSDKMRTRLVIPSWEAAHGRSYTEAPVAYTAVVDRFLAELVPEFGVRLER